MPPPRPGPVMALCPPGAAGEEVCGGAAPAGCVACASVFVMGWTPEGCDCAAAPCGVPEAVPVGGLCPVEAAPGWPTPADCCEGVGMPSRGLIGTGPAALVGPA